MPPIARRPHAFFPLLSLLLLLGCRSASITGEIFEDGSCAAVIDGEPFTGPERGVRLVSRAVDPDDPDPRHVLIVYCSLHQPDEEPVRIDFVKLRAPADGVLEPGTYTIDTEGDQPRSIGVVVTAPALLDPARTWRPASGTLEITSADPRSIAARFEMELR
jgi:hypothetical protein